MNDAGAVSKDETEKGDEITDSADGTGKEASTSGLIVSDLHKGTASNIPEATRDQIIATLYGQCMGDAIGL